MFFNQFESVCHQASTSPTAYVVKKGMSRSNVTRWKNGELPSREVLQSMSEDFQVSIDYLLGNEQKEAPTTNGERSEHDKLVDEAMQLMEGLSPANRKAALKMLDALLESQKTEEKK